MPRGRTKEEVDLGRALRNEPGLWAVTSITLVIFCTRLWEGSLQSDPATYAAVAKGIVESGDWLRLRLGSEPYLNKPPLLFWLTALGYHILGVSTFASHLWSALFSVGVAIATWLVARRWFGPRAALFAGLAAVLHHDFLRYGGELRMDSAVTFFLLFSVLDGERALGADARSAGPRTGLWLALGFLAKGPVAAIGIVWWVVFAAATGRARALLRLSNLGGLALAGLPWILWPLVQYVLGSGEHAERAFQREIGERFLAWILAGEWAGFLAAPLKYGERIVTRYWPWGPFALLGAWRLARERALRSEQARLVLTLGGVTFGLLLLPDPRYGRYLMPLWPTLALLAGLELDARTRGAAWVGKLERWLPAGAGVLVLVLLALPVPLHRDSAAVLRRNRARIEALEPRADVVHSYVKGSGPRRGQVVLYLDRDLVALEDLQALKRAGPRIVLSAGQPAREVTAVGWKVVDQDENWTVLVPPPD